MALRWSAQCLKFKAINMVLLRSTTRVVIRVANTFRAKPVEVYLPDPHRIEYDNLLRSLEKEFTYAFGGCTIVRGMEGNYHSYFGAHLLDAINLIYTDVPLALSVDFALIAGYVRELKGSATEALGEEAVMVAVEQIYHAV
jgi:hypothetical protein